MKRYLLTLVILVGLCAILKADDSIPKQVWTDIQSSSTLHILDNGTPGFFYDFADHEMMSGATTEIYKYRHFSGDFGLVRSIENRDRVIPIIGVNIHLGSFLARFDTVNQIITNLKLNQGLLQYFVAGAWSGQDFNANKTRYGFYSGFRAEFK